MVFKNGRAALINASVSHLALDAFVDRIQTGRECISAMLKGHCREIINELSRGPVKTEGCGIAAFVDEGGDTMLLPINYSPYDQDALDIPVPAAIILDGLDVSDAVSEHDIECFYKDGKLVRMEFELLPHQCAVIKLVK